MNAEQHRRQCEVRAIAAMTRERREAFARGASVKRCRRDRRCPKECDRGPGCGRDLVMALLRDAHDLVRGRR
ncbi:MAG: hypothetical protein AB7Q97_01940 [Gammaproteobacteria bacterium]